MSSFRSLINPRHLSKNSIKVENGISIKAEKSAAIALYCFQVLDIQPPILVIGKNKISEINPKTPDDSSSMVNSWERDLIAVPANKIKAMKIKLMMIEEIENSK